MPFQTTKERGGEVTEEFHSNRQQLNNFIQSNPVVLAAWEKHGDGTAPTPEKFATLSSKNAEFKTVLESELQQAGLLVQWQQFVSEFERRQAFEIAKNVAEAGQAARTATSAVSQLQDNQEYSDKLGKNEFNKFVRPSKVEPRNAA